MLFRYHGEPTTPLAAETEAKARSDGRMMMAAGGTPATVGFMFGDLADDPENRLPEGPDVIEALTALGTEMAAAESDGETTIPAAYTYLGQFIDHDITKTEFDPLIQRPDFDKIAELDFKPLTRDEVASLAVNKRTPRLDLDSVYTGLAETEATEPDGRMRLSEVSPAGFGTIATAERTHDLPRREMIVKDDELTPAELELDRQALIGDPRNDENLLVGQLHVAFLRSHNALMKRELDGAAARTEMRRRYQWAVLHDFLPRICDPDVVENVLAYGATFWKVEYPKDLFMPAEFAGAAYRFGHSMIREEYSHNATFNPGGIPATFNFFFTFTALSGDLAPGPGPNKDSPTLPDNWIIDWPRFFSPPAQPQSGGLNPARRLDARLAMELGTLRNNVGDPIASVMGKLAARNLLRGYLLGLPTGQAVATKLNVAPLTAAELETATPPAALDVVRNAGLLERTPLWFYVLAEADLKADGQHLGPVGSRIVAETLWNLAFHSEDSVLREEANKPTAEELATGEFTLKGLVKIGQDPGMPQLD